MHRVKLEFGVTEEALRYARIQASHTREVLEQVEVNRSSLGRQGWGEVTLLNLDERVKFHQDALCANEV